MWLLRADAPSQDDQPDDIVSQQRMDQPAPVDQSAGSVVVPHSADVACQPATTRDLSSDSVDVQQLLAELIIPLCHNIEPPVTVHQSAGTLVAEHSAGVVYDSYDKPPADISDPQLVYDNVNPPFVGSASQISAAIPDIDHSTKRDIGLHSTTDQSAVATVMFYGIRKRRPKPSAPYSPPVSVGLGRKSRK
jgi:hypothetical protein